MRINKPEQSYDLVVVGGGMVGASFACAIGNQDLSVLVVEAVAPNSGSLSQPSFDARSTALSYGSSRIFERMGLWQQLAEVVTAIKEIHVSDKGRFGAAQLSHKEHQVEALGYVIENRKLGMVLNTTMEASKAIHLFCPASISSINPNQAGMTLSVNDKTDSHSISTSLVVLAEGGRSPVCDQLGITRTEEHYKQHALIANIVFEKPHHNIAYERFTDTGPLAVLPLESIGQQNRGSLVWTLSEQQSTEFMSMDDAELLEKLQERFGNRLGKLQQIGERFCYPLVLSLAKEQIRPGLVLLGNVAHTLHPVAGQGLNLALRDTAALVEILQKAHSDAKPLGDMSVLQQYLNRQKSDQDRAIKLTDYMTRLFSTNSNVSAWIRKFGLLSIDLLPSIRRSFADQAMGLSDH